MVRTVRKPRTRKSTAPSAAVAPVALPEPPTVRHPPPAHSPRKRRHEQEDGDEIRVARPIDKANKPGPSNNDDAHTTRPVQAPPRTRTQALARTQKGAKASDTHMPTQTPAVTTRARQMPSPTVETLEQAVNLGRDGALDLFAAWWVKHSIRIQPGELFWQDGTCEQLPEKLRSGLVRLVTDPALVQQQARNAAGRLASSPLWHLSLLEVYALFGHDGFKSRKLLDAVRRLEDVFTSREVALASMIQAKRARISGKDQKMQRSVFADQWQPVDARRALEIGQRWTLSRPPQRAPVQLTVRQDDAAKQLITELEQSSAPEGSGSARDGKAAEMVKMEAEMRLHEAMTMRQDIANAVQHESVRAATAEDWLRRSAEEEAERERELNLPEPEIGRRKTGDLADVSSILMHNTWIEHESTPDVFHRTNDTRLDDTFDVDGDRHPGGEFGFDFGPAEDDDDDFWQGGSRNMPLSSFRLDQNTTPEPSCGDINNNDENSADDDRNNHRRKNNTPSKKYTKSAAPYPRRRLTFRHLKHHTAAAAAAAVSADSAEAMRYKRAASATPTNASSVARKRRRVLTTYLNRFSAAIPEHQEGFVLSDADLRRWCSVFSASSSDIHVLSAPIPEEYVLPEGGSCVVRYGCPDVLDAQHPWGVAHMRCTGGNQRSYRLTLFIVSTDLSVEAITSTIKDDMKELIRDGNAEGGSIVDEEDEDVEQLLASAVQCSVQVTNRQDGQAALIAAHAYLCSQTMPFGPQLDDQLFFPALWLHAVQLSSLAQPPLQNPLNGVPAALTLPTSATLVQTAETQFNDDVARRMSSGAAQDLSGLERSRRLVEHVVERLDMEAIAARTLQEEASGIAHMARRVLDRSAPARAEELTRLQEDRAEAQQALDACRAKDTAAATRRIPGLQQEITRLDDEIAQLDQTPNTEPLQLLEREMTSLAGQFAVKAHEYEWESHRRQAALEA